MASSSGSSSGASSSSSSSSHHHHQVIIPPSNLQPHTSTWLIREVLKRTDIANGDLCLFHYPIVTPTSCSSNHQVPFITMEDMQYAFDKLALLNNNNENDDSNVDDEEGGHTSETRGMQLPPEYVERAQAEARDRITRIQFCWYQFQEFPRLTNTYVNIQHVDIRQNASLISIDSIITQLPNLSSFNLSDCPNVRTLAPLASVLFLEDDEATSSSSSSNNNNGSSSGSRRRHRRNRLALRHLWVRGCDLSHMASEEWSNVFEALAESTGPLERLTLSRNNMSYLHGSIGKLTSLTYLFLEDNNSTGGSSSSVNKDDNDATTCGFVIPEEIGQLQNLRFASLCGNDITRLPRQVSHLNPNCDVYLHRNPNLRYPPPQYSKSIQVMRQFFHRERMTLLRGSILFIPHVTRARWRALERLYQPGGSGYFACKDRFEESVRRTSITY